MAVPPVPFRICRTILYRGEWGSCRSPPDLRCR